MASRPFDRAAVLIPLMGLLWGSSWPLFAIALRELSVWTFRAVAVAGAGFVLLLMARARGDRLTIPRALWPRLVAASLGTVTVWYVAATAAVLFIPSGQASVLGYTMPLWAALMSVVFLGDRPTPRGCDFFLAPAMAA